MDRNSTYINIKYTFCMLLSSTIYFLSNYYWLVTYEVIVSTNVYYLHLRNLNIRPYLALSDRLVWVLLVIHLHSKILFRNNIWWEWIIHSIAVRLLMAVMEWFCWLIRDKVITYWSPHLAGYRLRRAMVSARIVPAFCFPRLFSWIWPLH